MFKTNVGMIDRAVRLIVAAGMFAFALGYILPGNSLSWLGWIFGTTMLVTVIFSTCPLYSLFGFSGCPLKRI